MKTKLITTILILLTVPAIALASLTAEEKLQLFEKANTAFEKANAQLDDPQSRKENYQTAILAYKTIIEEGRVRNPKLYYNLANAYLLNGQIGNAILNYRRAQKLDDSDSNINKNLAYARTRRADKFTTPAETKILQTLFFWHYDFAVPARFTVATLNFSLLCVSLIILVITGRKSKMIIPAVIFFILFAAFASSVIIEQKITADKTYGVITAETATARQGNGQSYAKTFTQPLHEGTEFQLLEKRGQWLHIRLPDNTDTWIKAEKAELI